VPPNAQPIPEPEPVKVEIVKVPRQGRGSWITTAGPTVIAALALVVAILAFTLQRSAGQAAQAAANEQYAVHVMLIHEPDTSTFEVQNFQSVSIHSVWLAPAAHMLESLGTIGGCKQSTVVLTATSQPDVYFIDVNNVSWELTSSDHLQPAADPSAVIELLPQAIESYVSTVPPPTTPVPNCS
jgi:hypothetical protein